MQRLLGRWPAVFAAWVVACSVYDESIRSSGALSGGSAGLGASGAPDAEGGASNMGDGSGGSAGSSGASLAGAGAAVGGTGAASGSGGSSGNAGNAASAGNFTDTAGSGGEGGAPTVIDDCPDDPDKLAPGKCGCGVPDKSTANKTDCVTLKAKLAHRYDFEGSGTSVKDRIGTADGAIAGSATLSKLNGEGVVLLGGGSNGPYVNLPNGLLSALSSATLEAWVTWGGGSNWQRVFDFGDSNYVPPEDNPQIGKSYLFLTPKSASGTIFAAFSTNSTAQEQSVKGSGPLPLARSHVALAADAAASKLRLYVNGAKVDEQAWTGKLSQLNDVNVWLGRSQYNADPELSAVYHEFRVYNAALTDADIASSYAGGTDPAFLAY